MFYYIWNTQLTIILVMQKYIYECINLLLTIFFFIYSIQKHRLHLLIISIRLLYGCLKFTPETNRTNATKCKVSDRLD